MDDGHKWLYMPDLASLAHEMMHAYDDLIMRGDVDTLFDPVYENAAAELYAMHYENRIRKALFMVDPSCEDVYPRPGYQMFYVDIPGSNTSEAWSNFDGRVHYTTEDPPYREVY